MTLFLSCQALSKSFGSRPLFKDLSLGVFKGNKIGMIGPNGAGKSTLLKILAGLESPDEGLVTKGRSIHVGYVPQDSAPSNKTIEEVLINALSIFPILDEIEKITQVSIILSKFGFPDPTALVSSLSGGWKKRLDIAKEVVCSPDVLLLDEPTNHLDLEGILWLEKFLKNAPFAYIIISHDRYFLENVTNHVIELNQSYPRGLFSVEGSYSNFIEKKEEFLSGQQQQERSIASKLRRELDWLKQTPKARTTKAQSRVQDAHELIEEFQEVKTRNKESKSQFNFSTTKRQTQKFIVATNVAKSIGGRELFSDVNLTLSPGTRLGIVGLNGSGKTTLLKILAGEIEADKGTLKYADGLKIIYFDQHRTHIDPKIPLRQALAPTGETVNYRGQSIHVNSWCKRFLFKPDRLDLPFSQLSGGEKARVHIARLMLEPADVLLLDEPTNDLDLATLEVLEESLEQFPGAIVLISHDRYMLDQISTLILGLGENRSPDLFADYLQWEAFQAKQEAKQEIKKESDSSKSIPSKPSNRTDAKYKKFNYSEKREWEQMEGKILDVEKQIQLLQDKIHSPSDTNPADLQALCQELDIKQQELDRLYHRWEELEQKA